MCLWVRDATHGRFTFLIYKVRTSTAPHRGTSEAQQLHIDKALRVARMCPHLSRALRETAQLSSPCSARGLTPSFIHNPNGRALTECRVQSIARTSNGCLQREESFNNDPEKSHSEVTVKPAQSGLAWPSASWKRGSPPGNG